MELLRIPLDVRCDPADVLRAVRDDRAPFALIGAWAGGGAIVGSEPVRRAPAGADPFAVLDEHPLGAIAGARDAALGGPAAARASAAPRAPTPVGGGWFGHLGFALGARIERLPPRPPRPHPVPQPALAFYDHVIRLDAAGDWWFEALATPERRSTLEDRLAELRARLARGAPARPWRLDGLRPRPPGYAGHLPAVADGVRRIEAGEIFQANLCLRLEGELEGDPVEAFLAGHDALRPAYGAYFGHEWGAVLSFSPELFLRRRGRTVRTEPIKGTAPRDTDPAELTASAKDKAENVMIVDLMRNDLGRVARYGTVVASAAPEIQEHVGVWHLVSTVEAELRDGVGDGDLLRATFPPGSVTGAPKIQALHVISALEATAREVYTGAIGYTSPVAGLELNVAIRTLEVRGTHAWLGCGGGVVADSVPEVELAEALDKARPIAEALGASVPPPAPRERTPFTVLAARPDPAKGVFTTIGVREGRPAEVDAHLERLAASARELYERTLPDDLAERIHAAAAPHAFGRVRIDVTADGQIAVTGKTRATPPPSVLLTPVTLPGGLGAHKWADRSPLAPYETPTAIALILDADGTVLEAGSANVWIVEGDRLITPPADGRILPGVTRARLLERAGTHEEPFDLDRLRKADAILLTSSVRRITAGHLEQPDPRAVALAAELLRPPAAARR